MTMPSFSCVAGITMICYLLGIAIKATRLDNKYIPLMCGIFGGVLGVAGMYTMQEFPAADLITAAAVGISSGLAATGINETYENLK